MATKLLSTSAEEVLPRNTERRSWIISNEDSAISCYLKFEDASTPTVSSTVHDHLLPPGGLIALSDLTDGKQQVQGRLTAVAASGTPRIAYFETEDVKR